MYNRFVIFITCSLLVLCRPSFVRSLNEDPVFTENGGPKSDNLLEAEIIEQLAKQELARNWAQLSNKDFDPTKDEFEINLDENADSDTFDATSYSNWQRADSNRGPSALPKTAPKFKKQGQEEFSTFVDPIINNQPSYQRVAAKMSIMAPSAEKRAVAGGQTASGDVGDTVFIAVTTVCSAAAVFGLIGAGVCWHRLHKQYKMAQESEYPHYGVTGPSKERTSGNLSPVNAMDAKLASSAQLYHYQHTKQQIIAMEHSQSETKGNESEDSECEGEEGDFSVYECPGLAPTGDLEVSNPLFENTSPVTKTDPHREPSIHQHKRATE